MPILVYVKWKDAMSVEASSYEDEYPIPQLSVLQEVGWLLAENEEAILLGMELGVDDVKAGRWRINIPKIQIIARVDVDLRTFCAPKPPKKTRTPRIRPQSVAVRGERTDIDKCGGIMGGSPAS